MKKENGSMLLELLLLTSIIMMIFPIIYKQAIQRNERSVDNVLVEEMNTVSMALEKYIEEKGPNLSGSNTGKVYSVELEDLRESGLPDYIKNNQKTGNEYKLRIVKKNDKSGKSYLYGMVFASNPKFTPLRTRQISLALGEQGGYSESDILYGSYGTWIQNEGKLGLTTDDNSIILNTDIVKVRPEYLMRLHSEDRSQNTMFADLNMNNHDIFNLKRLFANQANFNQELTTRNLFAKNLEYLGLVKISALLKSESAVINNNLKLTGDAYLDVKDAILLENTGSFNEIELKDLNINNNLTIHGKIESKDTKLQLLVNGNSYFQNNTNVKAAEVDCIGYGSVVQNIFTQEIKDITSNQYSWNLLYKTFFTAGSVIVSEYKNLISLTKSKISEIDVGQYEFNKFLNDNQDIKSITDNLEKKYLEIENLLQ